LKDHTPNYSSQHSIPLNKDIKKLYVVTGKGGVGKTTLSMALTKYLAENERKVLYISFDQPLNEALCQQLNIPFTDLTIHRSAELYIGKKLNSSVVASWVMKTPFFLSLFNMIPGLGHMIYLGHIINKLEKDPNLSIILDSPSSGHALTMFESSFNFKEMFGEGVLVKDIVGMHNFLQKKNALKVLVSCLPTAMAIHEGQELKTSLHKYAIADIQIMVNDAFLKTPHLSEAVLPEFLQKKIDLEKEILNENESSIQFVFPHLLTLEKQIIIQTLSTQMGALI